MRWIACLSVLVACGPTVRGDTYQELLDDAVRQGLPGAALHVVDEDGVFDGRAGLADVDGDVAWGPDHLFRIASMSKAWLGVVAAQLHAEGAIDLDRPLGDYVAADVVDGIPNAREATVRQALRHTSGVADYLGTDGFLDACVDDPARVWTPQDALAFADGEPASFPPGEAFEYSNSNYLLAGLAVDAAAGRHHAAEIRARIIEPLGLTHTFYEHQEAPPFPLVHGYGDFDEDGQEDDVLDLDQGYGLADGGIVSTASDVARFVAAVASGADLLDAEARAVMFDGVAGEDGEVYGLGISVQDTARGEAVGHGGALTGYTSEMFTEPATGTTLVLLVNDSEDPLFDALLDAAIALLH